MTNERYQDHEGMIRRVMATGEGRFDTLTEGDVYALTHCLEHVSDRERDALGGFAEYGARLRNKVGGALALLQSREPVVMSPASLMELQRYALDEVRKAVEEFDRLTATQRHGEDKT